MNEDKFTGKAQNYAQYRPTYADGFIDYLYSEVGLKAGSVIADIGSGTGILTSLLLRRGSTVFGVEPNDDMRQAAEATLREHQNFVSVNGTAESTGLPGASADFVTAAQAFHWFDRERFKAECRRILRPVGKVILLWNRKDNTSPLVLELDSVHRKFCPDYTGFSGGLCVESPESVRDFFRARIVAQRMFQNDMLLDHERFIGGCFSASYAPHEDAKSYLPYKAALSRVFDKYQRGGTLRLPNQTWSYTGLV